MKQILLVFIMFALGACSPSESAIQTAIAQTQAVIPTIKPTVNPCSDTGWNEITTLLKQFDQKIKTLSSIENNYSSNYIPIVILRSTPTPTPKPVYRYLRMIINQIGAKSIDSCTEYARRLIIAGLDYQMSAVFDPQISAEGMGMVLDGIAELEKLGIYLDYP